MLEIIGVPIDSVGRAGGTEHSPRVLRELGLREGLSNDHLGGVHDAGDLLVRVRGEDRDSATGVVAWPDIAAMTDAVVAAVTESIGAGRTPVVIGGCCALEPAAVAGAKRVLGAIGLVHVDGHLDLYNGVTSPTGEAADMPNSVLLGLGPAAWTSLLGSDRVLEGTELVVVGHRDPDELTDGALEVADANGVGHFSADEVRLDPFGMGQRAASALSGPTWVHLDVDVLDQEEFPATDYLLPGGLTLEELRATLKGIYEDGRVAGFSLGCYNPEKDVDRSSGERLVTMLADVLSSDMA